MQMVFQMERRQRAKKGYIYRRKKRASSLHELQIACERDGQNETGHQLAKDQEDVKNGLGIIFCSSLPYISYIYLYPFSHLYFQT
jgi:hypothetical protein